MNQQSTAEIRHWNQSVADYEEYLETLSRQFASEAIRMVGGVYADRRVLDVAAGTGALSIAAARLGASVLATDISPGMVERLAERLAEFPSCSARVMDAHDLDIADATFDAAFCFFGIFLLADWRRGLRELHRVVRPGGYACVLTTRDPLGAGQNAVLFDGFRRAFPTQGIPPMPVALMLLSDPKSLESEMRTAGFERVEVRVAERSWSIASLDAFAANLDRIYSSYPLYATLEPEQRRVLQPALIDAAQRFVTASGAIEMPTVALLAAGRKPE